MPVVRLTCGVLILLLAMQPGSQARQRAPGVQEAAWAPDGRRIAVSYLDRIWTMAPDGRQPRALARVDSGAVEREPAWSPDGARIAYAANKGDGFDIVVATVRTGAAS
ncbi:MAG: PD40 domain-containing protein, partial [Acidobacteria bacterium]|nr:PD40 domain-containing protein [Acidobacteriota bacterium]